MSTNSINPIWPVLGGLFVIGIGYCIVQFYKKDKLRKKKVIQTSQTGTQNNSIVELFSLHIKHFSGTMNSLCDIINGSSELYIAEINFNNLEQIIAARNNEELKKWFSIFSKDRNTWDIVLYKDKATEIMNILLKCGIRSQNEKTITWSNQSIKKYYKPTSVQPGQECIVEAPYWTYNGEIFEKGLVTVK
ncbi:MAG: hypothetical protein PUD79_04555 [Prevotellaceae bacterium]|nr:hypothetical protein [Prevotellaceae bacterium]